MTNDEPKRIPLHQFTEYFMTEQRAHYDNLLAKVVRQIEEFDLDDEKRRCHFPRLPHACPGFGSRSDWRHRVDCDELRGRGRANL